MAEQPVKPTERSIEEQEKSLVRMIAAYSEAQSRNSFSRINGKLPSDMQQRLNRICDAGERINRARTLLAGRMTPEQIIQMLQFELQNILDWAREEKAPLRDQEIQSIEKVLVASKEGIQS